MRTLWSTTQLSSIHSEISLQLYLGYCLQRYHSKSSTSVGKFAWEQVQGYHHANTVNHENQCDPIKVSELWLPTISNIFNFNNHHQNWTLTNGQDNLFKNHNRSMCTNKMENKAELNNNPGGHSQTNDNSRESFYTLKQEWSSSRKDKHLHSSSLCSANLKPIMGAVVTDHIWLNFSHTMLCHVL